MGNYDKAIDSYNSALNYLPNEEDKEKVYLALGNCSFNLEQYESAVEHYSKYLETANTNEKADMGEIYFHRGISHIQLAKYEEAVNDLSSAIELGLSARIIGVPAGVGLLYDGAVYRSHIGSGIIC